VLPTSSTRVCCDGDVEGFVEGGEDVLGSVYHSRETSLPPGSPIDAFTYDLSLSGPSHIASGAETIALTYTVHDPQAVTTGFPCASYSTVSR